MSALDEATGTLLSTLADALVWRDGERPRVYGTRLAELRGMLRHAVATGDLAPLRTWLAADASASSTLVDLTRANRPTPARSAIRPRTGRRDG